MLHVHTLLIIHDQHWFIKVSCKISLHNIFFRVVNNKRFYWKWNFGRYFYCIIILIFFQFFLMLIGTNYNIFIQISYQHFVTILGT
jgi:hypothetical protein